MTSTWVPYLIVAAGLLFAGIYCLLAMRNLIKLFIGVEIISKSVSLIIVATGFAKKNILVAQSLAVTFIVVEVSLVATALAIIINIYRHTKSLDIRKLSRLKG
jgi:NADH:ubiquinone oxidoreductase subunit K